MADATDNGDGLHCWVPGTFTMDPLSDGPLSGTAFAAKDLFAVEGHTSSFGHPRWRDTHGPARSTAPAVTALRAAGARLAGMAKLDQLAYSLQGDVGEGTLPVNPAHPGRRTGGSSSGSASAVSGGAADIALGTDTAGSVRVPAACCGVFGLRPTNGAVDPSGVLPLAPSFDTVGLLARDPELLRAAYDAAALTTANAGEHAGAGANMHASADASASTDPAAPAAGEGFTTVLLPDDCLEKASEETALAVRGFAVLAAGDFGLPLRHADLSGLVGAEPADLFSRLQSREVWNGLGAWVAENGDALDPDVRTRLRRCEALADTPEADVRADGERWAGYRDVFASTCPPGALVVLPVTADGPPGPGTDFASRQAFRAATLPFTAPASLAGAPQLVVPVGPEGLPGGSAVGVGLLAAPGHDRALLRVAETVFARLRA